MSSNKPPKKKVVTTSQKKVVSTKQKPSPAAKSTRSSKAKSGSQRRTTSASRRTVERKEPLIFGPQNYYLLLGAAGLMALGTILMSGGAMPDPDTWLPDRIYSPRRLVIAPIVMLAGLGLAILAIFKQPKSADSSTTEAEQ